MKILYIAPDITDSGGISRVVSLKANYFVNNLNHEVVILSVNDCSCNRFYYFDLGIKWYNIQKSENIFLFFWSYIRSIKKAITQEKPEVIVICDAVLWFFIPWFVKTKIPIIFETHFSIFFKKEEYTNSFYRKLRSKLILFCRKKALSKFSYSIFETVEGKRDWNLKNSEVIPNPLSFTVNNLAALVNKRAMAVCMNTYVKGLDRMLKIWSKIVEKYPDWALDIYGNWDGNTTFIKMADDLQITDKVNFLPPTVDIQSSYNQSAVFLMTSRTEAFGMVLIEAMASGVPCIAYDCPSGPRVIIEEGVNGFLIEDGNTDAFVQKLELLIADENLRIRMGRTAQESVEKYDIDFIMKKWEKLFFDLKNKD